MGGAGTARAGKPKKRPTPRSPASPTKARQRRPRPGPIVLFIVAPDQLRVYEHLKDAISKLKLKGVELIPDRRRRQRRQRSDLVAVDQRRGDRRSRADTDEQVSSLGWSVVRL